MSVNKSLIDYVVSLDDENIATVKFVKKLKTRINYKGLLYRFKWTPEYFEELDIVLTKLGYQGQDEAIAHIRNFLTKQIKKISISTYNKKTGAALNDYTLDLKMKRCHMEMMRQLRNGIFVKPNRTTLDILSRLFSSNFSPPHADIENWINNNRWLIGYLLRQNRQLQDQWQARELEFVKYDQEKINHFNRTFLQRSGLKCLFFMHNIQPRPTHHK